MLLLDWPCTKVCAIVRRISSLRVQRSRTIKQFKNVFQRTEKPLTENKRELEEINTGRVHVDHSIADITTKVSALTGEESVHGNDGLYLEIFTEFCCLTQHFVNAVEQCFPMDLQCR